MGLNSKEEDEALGKEWAETPAAFKKAEAVPIEEPKIEAPEAAAEVEKPKRGRKKAE